MPELSVYGEYHEQLLLALASCDDRGFTETERIEFCFKCCMDHWVRVQRVAKEGDFGGDLEEEIHFFKRVKPAFTARIECYMHQYHALLFRPVHDVGELRRFWTWELQKIRRFYADNEGFCQYMQAGRTDMDEQYFLRVNNRNTRPVPGRLYELDKELMTSHDHLVTMIRTYSLYEGYVRVEMKKTQDIFL